MSADPHLDALLDRITGAPPAPPPPGRRARKRGERPAPPVDRWRWICAALDACPPACAEAGSPRIEAAVAGVLGPAHRRPIPSAWLDRLARGGACPAARFARSVTLSELLADRTLAGVEALVGRPELDGLTRLSIDQSAPAEACVCLGAYGRLAGLRRVDAWCQQWLGWCGDLEWFLGSAWARELDHLDLSESMGDGVDALVAHPEVSIGSLALAECWLTQAHVTTLLGWPAIARMRRLDIRLNCVQDPAAAVMASPYLHPGLTLIGLPPVADAPCTMVEWT